MKDAKLVARNKLYLSDNLDLLKSLYQTKEPFIDLIYIDPPFNSKKDYNIIIDGVSDSPEKAFTDTWSKVKYLDEMEDVAKISPELYQFLKMLETTNLNKSLLSYLCHLTIRVWYMRQLLTPTGSFYLHCDPTASHYIKVMLDYVFGAKNFRNEIVWHYKRWTASKKSLPKLHDIIFMYTKSDNYIFDPPLEENKNPNPSQYESAKDENGKTVVKRDENGKPVKREIRKKIAVGDVWNMSLLSPVAKERLGFPTQKPLALLERIIKASSNPGDLVADFYAGCGTSMEAADKLGRKWLGCDINVRGIEIIETRVAKYGKVKGKDYDVDGIPSNSAQLRHMVETKMVSRLQVEDIIIKYYLKNAIGNTKKVGDGSIDGRFMFKKFMQPEQYLGLVQITTGHNMNHFKAFSSEVMKLGDDGFGYYICFSKDISPGMRATAKSLGKVYNTDTDRLKFLTFEDVIDRNQKLELEIS